MAYNDSLLHDLVINDNHIESLKIILARRKDPNQTNSDGDTLILTAAKSIHDNPAIVQELVNAGADVCRLDSSSSTALHYAVIRGKRKVVDVLLQTGIPVNHKNSSGITALHYAVRRNVNRIGDITGGGTDMYIVRKLLDHRLINVNETDIGGETPLVWAIRNHDFEIVKMLLNKNARVDTFDRSRKTPLHHALYFSNHQFAVTLLLKKASVLAATRNGETPLDNIIVMQSIEFACICLKVIAFNYDSRGFFTVRTRIREELNTFLLKCWKEIDYMKKDIIADELTVFGFFIKCNTQHVFDNPILQVYKPVVEKLLNGNYPIYLSYILNRISKSTMYSVLEVYIDEKYYNEPCTMEYFAEFSKIILIRLLRKYLSLEEIFCLIVAFTGTSERDLLDFHKDEWYLTGLWDAYPDDHFC